MHMVLARTNRSCGIAALIVLLAVTIAGAMDHPFIAPHMDVPEGRWYYNSKPTEGSPALKTGSNRWMFLTKGGLLSYDVSTGKTNLLKINTGTFRSGVMVDGKAWIAANSLITVVDPDSMSSERSFSVSESTGWGGGGNLQLIPDETNHAIWASSFLELHRYDVEAKRWDGLTHVFSDLRLGAASSMHEIFPDENIVWINGAAHAKSRGGLLRYEANRGRWTVFRKALLGTAEDPDRIDHVELVSSPKHVWAYLYQGNAYNFYLAVYDKHDGVWRSYHRAGVRPAVDLLISELAECRWSHARPFLKYLDDAASSNLGPEHPFAFTSTETAVLRSIVADLRDAYSRVDPDTDTSRGLWAYSAQHGSVVEGAPYKPNHKVLEIPFPQISYEQLVGVVGERVLLQTDHGLALFDPQTGGVTFFVPGARLWQGNEFLLSKDGEKAEICEFSEGEDGPDISRRTILDLRAMTAEVSPTTSEAICGRYLGRSPSELRVSDSSTVKISGAGLVVSAAPR